MADESLGAQMLTNSENAVARAIEAVSKVMTELAHQANERHGETAVAQAFLKGIPCRVSTFGDSKEDEAKRRAFHDALYKKKIDFCELKKQSGGTCIFFREEDLKRVQMIIRDFDEHGVEYPDPKKAASKSKER